MYAVPFKMCKINGLKYVGLKYNSNRGYLCLSDVGQFLTENGYQYLGHSYCILITIAGPIVANKLLGIYIQLFYCFVFQYSFV